MSAIFVSCSAIIGQDHIQFKNYSISDGLSQSVVSTIVQDHLGALWLGTQDGINRFDGKKFKVFSVEKGSDISNDFINTSYVSIDGSIWFGTYSGLTKYDPKTVSFHSYQNSKTKKLDIQAIQEGPMGNIWVGTTYGRVYVFDRSKEQFILKDKSTFQSKIVDFIFEDKQLKVVSEFEGVLFTDTSFQNRKVVAINTFKENNIIVNAVIKHPESELLLATNNGAFKYNEKNGFFERLTGLFDELDNINIVDALYLGEEKVMIASENQGLFQVVRYNKDSVVVLNYSANYYQKGSLISNKISKLFKDNRGIVWIASERGISSFDPVKLGFRGVGFSAELSKGLPSQNVWGFDEDESGRYLFVAADHGISMFDRSEHKYYHFMRSPKNNEDYTTISLKVITKNRLLVGSVDGLFELSFDEDNPRKYAFQKIKHSTQKHRGYDKTYKIIPYQKDSLYLIGTKAGVAVLNLEKKSFQYVLKDPRETQIMNSGPCRLVFESMDGSFYFAPASGGIYEVVKNNNEYLVQASDMFKSLNDSLKDYITSIVEVKPHQYWVGTFGGGLVFYDARKKLIKHFGKHEGLPNNVIYGVEWSPSDPKHLWLSTNRGVVSMSFSTKQFFIFTEKDGLMSNELNLGASYVAQNNDIYFGGILGYNYISPEQAFQKNKLLNVYFSGIEVENKTITPATSDLLEKSITYTEKIVLPYNERSLKLTFFTDDLSNPERIEYKYIMRGDDEVEEELGSSNELRFASIASGRYELSVYARKTNGGWNSNPAKLIIEVEKPIWLHWWFIISLSTVFILTIFYLVRKSLDKERRQQVILEMKIAERTRELQKKTDKIEEQKSRLEIKTKELAQEKEKSERLLNNILPKETASQLKKEGRSGARDFDMVSIMFTDFVGFTKIAEDMKAKDLVSVLDKHFRKFDSIIEQNNLEKIKTIGDAYMCAGGVPIRNKTNPINTVLAAVQIKKYMQDEKEEMKKKGEPYWRLRIGVNTGPVSAGVIGTKRYAYDVWGSTVNRAQRMEQMCDPERIAITEDTFEHVEPYFECRRVGNVVSKSGMKITMYEVVSLKPELSIEGKGVEPNEAFHQLVNLHHYSQINYSKAERFILSKLEKELNPKLHYHSFEHSKDVTRQAERIAIGEGITDEDLFLLKSAASYHDAGFVEQYDKNEPIGAEMAEEILPSFGYTPANIKIIKELIYVTQIPHQPKNKLEEIICDADLDYLGRDDFHEIADKLRQELKEQGKIDSDKEWDKIQVSFISQHRYFTRTSIETRKQKKLQNLAEIKARLERGAYED